MVNYVESLPRFIYSGKQSILNQSQNEVRTKHSLRLLC